MQPGWHALHAQLVRSSERLSFHERFTHITKRNRALAGFAQTPGLMDHQHDPGGNFAKKDAVLRALVTGAQTDGSAADTAKVLVMLAHWPGLDALHGRLRRYFQGDGLRCETACNSGSDAHLMQLGVRDTIFW